MEKSASNTKRPSTIIDKLFSTIFMLVLLTLVSWVLLTVWTCICQLQENSQAQHILDCEQQALSHFNQHNTKTTILDCFRPIELALNNINQKISAAIVLPLKIITLRGLIFLLSLPLFVMVWFVLIVDGLVQRDIRKYQGARESAFLFHRLKPLAGTLFFTLFMVYMVIPIAVTPELILLPMVLLSGAFLQLSIKHFKKYL